MLKLLLQSGFETSTANLRIHRDAPIALVEAVEQALPPQWSLRRLGGKAEWPVNVYGHSMTPRVHYLAVGPLPPCVEPERVVEVIKRTCHAPVPQWYEQRSRKCGRWFYTRTIVVVTPPRQPGSVWTGELVIATPWGRDVLIRVAEQAGLATTGQQGPVVHRAGKESRRAPPPPRAAGGTAPPP